VINAATDLPIKYDGLIGNAVIRGGNLSLAQTRLQHAVSAYAAVTIQADTALANLAAIADQPGALALTASRATTR
jgi:hypothetical protein